MANKVRITYYGMEGEGRNLTEAKKDAGRKIERALSGYYDPILISAHGKSALVYRDQTGWGYSLLHPERAEEHESRSTTLYGSCGETQEEAERRARSHLAQNILTLGGPTGVEVIQNEQDRREHIQYCEFQYCYRAWKDSKLESNENKIHEMACRRQWPDGVEPWTWDGQS